MKKWISMLLVLALLLGALTGCGSSQAGSASEAEASSDQSAAQSRQAEEAQSASEKTNMLTQTAEQAKNAASAAAQMQDAAQQVSDMIDGLGEIDPESGPELDQARAAYDALSADVRGLVGNYDQLEAAEASYAEMTESISRVEEAIDGLGEITAESGDAIEAARDLYEALPEKIRGYVGNYTDLVDAEDTCKALVEEQGLADVQALIDAGEYEQAMTAGEDFLRDHTVSDESAFRELIDTAHLDLAWQYYNGNYLEYTQDELDDLWENAESESVLAGVQDLQNRLDAWLASIEPANGKVLSDTTGSGYGELTVLAGSTPIYIRVEKVNNPSSYFSFYVRADSQATISGVEDGDYYVLYATGDTWYGESELFGRDTSAYQADDIMEFDTTYYGNTVEYSIITLTLYAVEGGNMTSSNVDPSRLQ